MSLFSKTKDFFWFLCNKKSPKDATGKWSFFLHTLFLTNEEQTSKKRQGGFSIKLKPKCKNLVTFEQKNTTQNHHLVWFCTHPFNYSKQKTYLDQQVKLHLSLMHAYAPDMAINALLSCT